MRAGVETNCSLQGGWRAAVCLHLTQVEVVSRAVDQDQVPPRDLRVTLNIKYAVCAVVPGVRGAEGF